MNVLRKGAWTWGVISLAVFALALGILGAAYLTLAATATLLPGDLAYLDMSKARLCSEADCHIVDFITHNRAAYGGAIVALSIMSGWLVAGPLRDGAAWAWWTLLVAGGVECGCSIGFIAYGQTQAYGFGAWHVVAIAVGTSGLVAGLLLTRSAALAGGSSPVAALRRPGVQAPTGSPAGIGRAMLVFLALGFSLSGFSVLMVALTTVFVPQDISFLGLDATGIEGVSDRLLPLVAHDRAEFGVGMMAVGVLIAAAAWKGLGVHGWSLWFAIAGAGGVHFASVIASHVWVGYTDLMHLAPVYGALALLTAALVAWRPKRPTIAPSPAQPRPMPIESARPSI